MSNIEHITLLPNSIYEIGAGSVNYKLWKLFSDQMDELDAVFSDLSLLADYTTQEGVLLDLIGKILRENRQGRSDQEYIKFLYIALKKYLSSGSIPDLNEICRLVLGDDFRFIRDLNFGTGENDLMLDGSWYLDDSTYLSGDEGNPDITWLDGSWYLDGSNYLSGDIYQPRLFEVVVNAGIDASLMSTLTVLITSCRGAGIKALIRELEA
ncbi:MAG TPA: hypothetical protein PKY31_11980 [Spirochaetota bacterium]|nr:hypothetical protein [Spirochaetota bacterium]